MESTPPTLATTTLSKKYLSPTWLVIYAIIGTVTGMIAALGPLRPVFRIAAFVIAVVALVQLIRTRKQHKNLTGWILLIIYAILWFITPNVGIG